MSGFLHSNVAVALPALRLPPLLSSALFRGAKYASYFCSSCRLLTLGREFATSEDATASILTISD